MSTHEAAELMLRYLEGDADAAEVARLEAALRASPELVATCADVSRQHLQLSELAEEAAFTTTAPLSQIIDGGFTRRRSLWPLLAAAAALVAGAFLFLQWKTPADGVAAEIIATDDAGAAWQTGARVSLRALELATGSVRLRLENGALVTLTAPVAAEFLSPLRVHVRRGQLTADVSGGGKGFVVEANGTEVVDLGTQFGVKVRGKGETDVVVFEGEVQLQKANVSKAKPWLNLNGGEAVSLDTAQHAKRIQAVYGEAGSAAWSLESSTNPETLIQSIGDNITLPDFQGYYGVSPGGMRPGAAPYNVGPRWGEPEGGFPAELLGADLVTTFQDKRFNADFALTFTLNHPATVYVMHDDRQPPPEWLSRDFSKTQHSIPLPLPPGILSAEVAATVPIDAKGRLFLTFSVWKRDVPAGKVVLGESLASSARIPHFMYGLAIKRR